MRSQKLKSLANDESDKEKQLEILNFQIDELEAADIKIGEREELTKKRELIQKSEDIIKALNLAVSTINGDDENTGVEQLATMFQECFLNMMKLRKFLTYLMI